MNSQKRKDLAPGSRPEGELESPFLEEEFFAEESEPGREARLALLEAESPFVSALERPTDRVAEQEDEDEEFYEDETAYTGEEPGYDIEDEELQEDEVEEPEEDEEEDEEFEDEEATGEREFEDERDHQAFDKELEEALVEFLADESESVDEQEQIGKVVQRLFILSSPSPRADPTVAVPPFTFLKRLWAPVPVLSPTENKAAVLWNQRNHPAVSDVKPDHIRTDLARYVNFAGIKALIQSYNTSHSSAPIDMGTPPIDAVFVEAVHQFQAKCFFEKSQIDGKAGESTLDSLGIVKRKGLNTVDKRNRTALRRLRKVDVPAETGGEFTAANWFEGMVNPTFLGWRYKNGIHLILARKLRLAENWLLSLPQYKGKTPVELGQALGFDDKHERHRGARPDKATNSMHTFGLAVDIKYSGNPYVRGSDFTEVLKRAALLISGVKISQRTSEAFFHNLGSDPALSTKQIYDVLSRRDQDFRKYLALRDNPQELRRILDQRRAISDTTGTEGVFKSGTESLNDATLRWQGMIRRDYRKLSDGSEPFLSRGPENGFLNLPEDLVIALRDQACLAWGAVDFGANACGDMMHFDARVCAVGDRLTTTARRQHRVTKGHPCLPCPPRNGRSSQREEELVESPDKLYMEEFDELDETLYDKEFDAEDKIDEYEFEDELYDAESDEELYDELESFDEFEAEEPITALEFDQEAGEALAEEISIGDESELQEYIFQDVDFEREIIGEEDTRVLVKDPLAVPYRWICALDLYYENPDYGPDQPRWIVGKGTGVLIDSYYVLTVAHALYDLIKGSQGTKKRVPVKKIIVTPARNGAKKPPLGSTEAEKWLANRRWKPKKFSHDFGLIKLKEEIGLKQYPALNNQPLGWWGSKKYGGGTYFKRLDPDFLKDRKVWSAGYPADKCGKRPEKGSLSKTGIQQCEKQTPELWASFQWIGSGKLTWVKPEVRLMHHTIDTYKGQSGSPIWYRYKDRRWLVGIHVAPASPKANFAVRVTKEFIDEVKRLKKMLLPERHIP